MAHATGCRPCPRSWRSTALMPASDASVRNTKGLSTTPPLWESGKGCQRVGVKQPGLGLLAASEASLWFPFGSFSGGAFKTRPFPATLWQWSQDWQYQRVWAHIPGQ